MTCAIPVPSVLPSGGWLPSASGALMTHGPWPGTRMYPLGEIMGTAVPDDFWSTVEHPIIGVPPMAKLVFEWQLPPEPDEIMIRQVFSVA